MATYQRLALSRISEEVADATLDKLPETFAAIYNRVLEFTGRGLFAQVSSSQHHHRFYSLCQTVFQVSELHREVRDEVEAMKEFSESVVQERAEKVARRLDTLIAVITGVLIPLQVWIAVFADRVIKWPVAGSVSPTLSLWLTLVFVVLCVVTTAGFLRWWRR